MKINIRTVPMESGLLAAHLQSGGVEEGHLDGLQRDSVQRGRQTGLELLPEVAGPGPHLQHQVEMLEADVSPQMFSNIEAGQSAHRHSRLLEVWHRTKSSQLKKGQLDLSLTYIK